MFIICLILGVLLWAWLSNPVVQIGSYLVLIIGAISALFMLIFGLA